jgi:hypothetical protein
VIRTIKQAHGLARQRSKFSTAPSPNPLGVPFGKSVRSSGTIRFGGGVSDYMSFVELKSGGNLI